LKDREVHLEDERKTSSAPRHPARGLPWAGYLAVLTRETSLLWIFVTKLPGKPFGTVSSVKSFDLMFQVVRELFAPAEDFKATNINRPGMQQITGTKECDVNYP
jgi:hypothetical protein